MKWKSCATTVVGHWRGGRKWRFYRAGVGSRGLTSLSSGRRNQSPANLSPPRCPEQTCGSSVNQLISDGWVGGGALPPCVRVGSAVNNGPHKKKRLLYRSLIPQCCLWWWNAWKIEASGHWIFVLYIYQCGHFQFIYCFSMVVILILLFRGRVIKNVHWDGAIDDIYTDKEHQAELFVVSVSRDGDSLVETAHWRKRTNQSLRSKRFSDRQKKFAR